MIEFCLRVLETAKLYQFDIDLDGLEGPRPIGSQGYCIQCGEFKDDHESGEEAEPCYECGCRTVFSLKKLEEVYS